MKRWILIDILLVLLGFLALMYVLDRTLVSFDFSSFNPGNAFKTEEYDVESVVKASNSFAVSVYGELIADEEAGNVLFSPISLMNVLSMTAEGAVGKTRSEMDSVLLLPQDEEERRKGFLGVQNQIATLNNSVNLHTANSVWLDTDFILKQDYIDVLKENYLAKVESTSFRLEWFNSRMAINEWVSEQTQEMIPELIPEGSINGNTRVVLVNATYFSGDWLTMFDEENTQSDQLFKIEEEDNVTVDMMHMPPSEEQLFPYFENEEVQVLELPYKGERLSMVIVLPSEQHLEKLEEGLTPKQLKEYTEQLEPMQVSVYLPVFKVEFGANLKEILPGMGMPTAFSDAADFSNITYTPTLKITDVINQAIMELDEKGTTAAAASSVALELRSLPEAPVDVPVFRADHPFLFFIKDTETGLILFMGRLVDPSSS